MVKETSSQQLIHRLLEEKYKSDEGFVKIDDCAFEVLSFETVLSTGMISAVFINGKKLSYFISFIRVDENSDSGNDLQLNYRGHYVLYEREGDDYISYLFNRNGDKVYSFGKWKEMFTAKQIDEVLNKLYPDGLQSP